MKSSVGRLIKVVALIFMIVGVAAAAIAAIVCWATEVGRNHPFAALGYGLFFGGIPSVLLMGLLIYGFGELINKQDEAAHEAVASRIHLKKISENLTMLTQIMQKAEQDQPITVSAQEKHPPTVNAAPAAVKEPSLPREEVPATPDAATLRFFCANYGNLTSMIELKKAWTDCGFDHRPEFSQLTNELEKKAQGERMYGKIDGTAQFFISELKEMAK